LGREKLTSEGFAWAVTNLLYGDLEELATHLIGLGVRDHCSVALLLRAEWIVPRRARSGPRASSLRWRGDADDKAALGGAISGQRLAAA
jgi:hypothetical protein